MTGPGTEADKTGERIREMFAAVAPRYDLLNRLLSACLDQSWRRRAARSLSLPAGNLALDVCCGTGDQALALRRRRLRVIAADFCLPMLSLARRKFSRLDGAAPRGLAADTLHLPVASNVFSGVTVSFGLRNVADLDQALREMVRVLAPGGKAAILEFALPRNRSWRKLYLFYFRRLLPLIGQLISPRGSAYCYLPESVLDFPQREGFVDRMRRAGFSSAGWQDLTGGIVCLYYGGREG
jgi:demethylmenaquinone methyltransferase/2-methoxy-6-polyprenyl-1,4-benzoquinol methylase